MLIFLDKFWNKLFRYDCDCDGNILIKDPNESQNNVEMDNMENVDIERQIDVNCYNRLDNSPSEDIVPSYLWKQIVEKRKYEVFNEITEKMCRRINSKVNIHGILPVVVLWSASEYEGDMDNEADLDMDTDIDYCSSFGCITTIPIQKRYMELRDIGEKRLYEFGNHLEKKMGLKVYHIDYRRNELRGKIVIIIRIEFE